MSYIWAIRCHIVRVMVVSNPTLLVPKSLPPLSVSYVYLPNTERSSSGVRINDHARSNKVL